MIQIRLGTEKDEAFIYRSWLKVCKRSPLYQDVPRPLYYRGYAKEIEAILKKAEVVVLCTEDEDQIIGFIVVSLFAGMPALHFAYTKQVYRRMGMFKKLMQSVSPQFPKSDLIVTCYPPSFAKYQGGFAALASKYNLIYNPFVKGLI